MRFDMGIFVKNPDRIKVMAGKTPKAIAFFLFFGYNECITIPCTGEGEAALQKMPCVYMLWCADGTLYTGWTNDLDNRMRMHNDGKGAKYTRVRRPVRLAYSEFLPDRSAAMKRECEIKRLSRAQKLQLVQTVVPRLKTEAD
ncbi:GIY-YIG nuclease family protein [Candidatus Soleaferrea massiliensis]|uniref:GIY-YIG nuclease family protein n=1 Tax=Candidatus Soleaferrea massiliensis TaxID=1470354 RepID=UPI002A4E1778|nr:GIY-YIG nuclease family protein [Candidatus Soleaferrea massiliensis]